jgi:putative alpha-1,2-mannosidase
VIDRPGGRAVINAEGADLDAPYVTSLFFNGKPSTQAWLTASFAKSGGILNYRLSKTAKKSWGTSPQDAPPSFGP